MGFIFPFFGPCKHGDFYGNRGSNPQKKEKRILYLCFNMQKSSVCFFPDFSGLSCDSFFS